MIIKVIGARGTGKSTVLDKIYCMLREEGGNSLGIVVSRVNRDKEEITITTNNERIRNYCPHCGRNHAF